jgi:hypothetical protein
MITLSKWLDESGEQHEHISRFADFFRYVPMFDRAAQASSKQQAANAGAVAGQAQNQATQDQSQLTPFYQKEMSAQHGFDPTQMGELTTAALGGAGAEAGAAKEDAALNAGRTGNTAALSSTLGDITRAGTKAGAGASEGIAAEDVAGAKQLNQQGAAGLAGQEGMDTSTMLSSMGLQNQDTETQIKAGQSGWFQNLMQGIGAVTGIFKPGGGGGSGGGSGGGGGQSEAQNFMSMFSSNGGGS